MDEVSEAECLICRRWPAPERGERRLGHFTKDGVLLTPRHGMCPACELAFFEAKSATKQ
jgi:hypothetical protein